MNRRDLFKKIGALALLPFVAKAKMAKPLSLPLKNGDWHHCIIVQGTVKGSPSLLLNCKPFCDTLIK